jgi:hypothetical protein
VILEDVEPRVVLRPSETVEAETEAAVAPIMTSDGNQSITESQHHKSETE